MEVSDVAVIGQVRTGNSDAFRTLVERHSRAIFRVAYRMTRNEQDADDIVQETFLRAYRQIDHFEERSSFSTWLHRVAVNCALDSIRARKRRDAHPSWNEEEDPMDSIPSSEPAQDRLLMSAEVKARVSKALEDLSSNERTAFVLRHFEGMPIDEIGRTLGTQVNATKNTIFSAVKKIRTALEPLVRSTP